MGIPIEKVTADVFAMDYFRFGQGDRTMVILPGLSVQSVMASADAIADAYAVMAEKFTVYVFDRRADPPADYSLRQMAEDTAAAMRALGLRDCCLFGASQGGMIAMEMAIAHPDLVRKLALGSTAARVDDVRFCVFERWISFARNRDGVGLYLDFGQTVYPPEIFDGFRQALVDAGRTVTGEELERFILLAQSMRDYDVRDRLAAVDCPVLALGARDDAVFGPDATPEIAAALGEREDAKMYLYEGCGHAAFDTAPDYKERLLRFFAG